MAPQDSEDKLTFGEQLVGKKFNPSKDDKVAKVKALIAEAVDIVCEVDSARERKNDISKLVTDSALQQLLAAQMMAVKSLTLEK